MPGIRVAGDNMIPLLKVYKPVLRARVGFTGNVVSQISHQFYQMVYQLNQRIG